LYAFKEKNHALLDTFRNRIEQLTFIEIPEELREHQINELIGYKNELVGRMKEKRLGQLFYGGVCGIFATSVDITYANDTLSRMGAFAGFLSAIQAGREIIRNRPENMLDQSGMKYLALLERRRIITRE
jgi:hypothetical protein